MMEKIKLIRAIPLWLVVLVFLFIIAIITLTSRSYASDRLASITSNLKETHPVEQMSNLAFRKISNEKLVVFDVRNPVEYQVSHLKHAIQVDADISVDSFLKRHAKKVKNKKIVFYCSVGQRSSNLALRLDDELKQAGVIEIYNLVGGVFKWHNDNFSLVDNKGNPTRNIHPYNVFYGRLIEEKSLLKYK